MIKVLHRLYDWFEAHKVCFWLILVLSSAVMGFFALKVDYQEDITSFFPKDDAASTEAFENLKLKDKVVFMISGSEDPYELVDASYSLSEELEGIVEAGLLESVTEGVDAGTISSSTGFIYENLPIYINDWERLERICSPDSIAASIAECYKMLSSPAGMLVGDVLMKDPLNIATPMMGGFRDFDTGAGYEVFSDHIFSSGMSTLLMFANPSTGMGSTGVNDRLTSMIEDACKKVSEESGMKVEYFAAACVAAYNARVIKRDTILTLLIAILVIVLVITLSFRSRAAIPLILIPVGYGGLFALMLIGFIQGSVSAIAIGAGAAVMGVALSYSIHVIAHSNHTADPHRIIEELAYPLTIGSLTTIGAFAALIFTHSSLLHDFGLFTSLTLIGTTIFCLVFLPHFIKEQNTVTKSKTLKFIEKIVDYPLDRNKWVVSGLIAVFAVCCFTCWKVRFDNDMNHLNYMPAHLQAAEEKLAAISGDDSGQTFLVTIAEDMDSARARLTRLDGVLDSLSAAGAVSGFVSAGNYIIPTDIQKERIAKWNEFWADRREGVKAELRKAAVKQGFRENAFAAFEEILDKEYGLCDYSPEMIADMPLLCDWLGNEEGKALIVSRLKLDENADREEIYKAINSAEGASIVDRGYYANKMVSGINDDFNYILFISSLIVFIALLISYGRIELALLAFLPMAIGWVIILGLMAIFGVQFNIVSIILATFIFGIGDDFSIFIMDGLMARRRDGSELLSSHKTAIFFSAFTMLVGIGVLVIAQHPAMKSIGLISVLGIIVVLLVEFTVQPFLFRILVTNPTEKKRMYPVDLVCFLNSCWVWFAIGTIFITCDILAGILYITPLPKRWKKRFFHSFCGAGANLFLLSMRTIRKEWQGYDRKDLEKPCVIIANHQSLLDILNILATSNKFIVITKRSLFYNPIMGPLLRYLDCYPADEAAKFHDQIGERVKEGYSIVVFPEATRSKTGEVLRFHKGAFLMAEDFHLDIKPMVLYGDGFICPKGQDILCRPSRCVIRHFPRVPYGDESFGKTYQEKAKSWRQWYIREVERINSEYHHVGTNPWFVKRALMSNYIYKGPELEREVRRNLRRNGWFDELERSLPREGEIAVLGSGWGELPLLLGMLSRRRRVTGVEADPDKVKVAQNCHMAGDNVSFICADPSEYQKENDNVIVIDIRNL